VEYQQSKGKVVTFHLKM